MKLKLASNGAENYKYPLEMEYAASAFNGHQIGVMLCIQNNITGEIEKNYLPVDDENLRDTLLCKMLADEDVMLFTNICAQINSNNELVPKTFYYVMYDVVNHSRFRPTIIHQNISGATNVSYKAEVELLFVEDELTRYMTVPVHTRNVSIMDYIYDMFCLFSPDEDMKVLGIKWQEGNEYEEAGFVLDFYDAIGEKYNLVFSTAERLRDAIVSMRLIGIERHIDSEDEEDENT